jgi:hypothetical protein
MTSGAKSHKGQGGKGDAARAARLKAALRENLKRRKQQARQRSIDPARAERPAHDSAGFVPDKSED